MSIENIVEDWDNVKKRWEAWWNCELHDRVVMAIGAPRDNVPPADIPEVDTETQWTDVDFMIRRCQEITRTTWFGGELLPKLDHNWSAGHTLPFGCKPHFEQHTVWVDPSPVGADGYPSFDGWRDSPWWSWILESTEKAVRDSQGEYFVMPMWGNDAVDTLALMRGTEQFLMDVSDNPGWVTEAVNTLSDIMIEMYKEMRQIVDSGSDLIEGSVTGQRCWSPGKTASFDCDMSCMVSPKVFQDMFLTPLIRTMDLVDHRLYHFDGAIALHQMDTILETPEIHAVQWVPGDGTGGVLEWLPVIKRIQEKGKAVVVYPAPEDVEPLLREVSPEGLCICTGCETESEGRKLLERVAKMF